MNNVKKVFVLISAIILIHSLFIPGIKAIAETNAQDKNFSDIQTHWAKNSIQELIELGIIKGYEDGTFRPENEVTRAQFIAMTTRLLGIDSNGQSQTFSDIPTDHWAYSSIQGALEHGLLDKDKKFYPNRSMTREDMAIVISKGLKLVPVDEDELNFKDSYNIKKAPKLVAAAAQAGLIKGHLDGTFKPQGNLTRAQASVIFVRMYQYLEGIYFKDIENYWAADAIHSLVDLSIINGYEDLTFRPENKVTRAQFAAMIIRMMGYESTSFEPFFNDIQADHWAFSVIQAAVEQGIIKPDESNYVFSPNKPLTREEMAIMMARTLKLTPISENELTFLDKGDIQNERGLIAKTVKEGLITGHEDNTFRPKNPSTRGQAATILHRLYNYSINSSSPDIPTPLPIDMSEDEITLLGGVIELQENVIEYLEEIKDGDSTFIFKNSPIEILELKKDDIFVIPPSETYPTGFAEKVISIHTANGLTTIKTVDPELTEVFKEIDIQEVTDINFEDLIPIKLEDGVSFHPVVNGETVENNQNSTTIQSDDEGDFSLVLSDMELSINNTKVLVEGEVKFENSALVTDVDYSWGRLKMLKAVFVTEPTLETQLTVEQEIASGSATYKAFQGIYTDHSIPAFLGDSPATEPFEEKKLLGTFYIPVYGPAGANFEVFVHVRADLTVGFSVKLVEEGEMEVGLIAEKGKLTKVKKIDFKEPTATLSGKGGIQVKAGAGIGVKVAILKLSVGGIEGEVGLYGEAYANALVGIGDTDEIGNDDKELQGNICYRLGMGTFQEIRATFDALKIINMGHTHTLWDNKDELAALTNCDEHMLMTSPAIVILTPGEEQTLDLEYFKFSKEDLDLQDETKNMEKDDVSFELKGNEILSVKQNSSKGSHSFDVLADVSAQGGELGELTITYKKGVKRLKKSVNIIVTELEKFEVEPSTLKLDSGASKQLKTMGIYKKPIGIDLEDVLEDGITIEELFKRPITDFSKLTFKSMDESIATVDQKGMVKAKELVQEDSTEIVVTYMGKEIRIPVTVKSKAYSGGGGGSSVNQQLELFRLIILEAEEHANNTFKPEAESTNPASFEDLKPMLTEFYTEQYFDYWKKVYDYNIAWFNDPHLLYPLTEATEKGTGNTFKITSDSTNLVKATVNVPLRENEVPGEQFNYEYTLVKEDNRWRLDTITCKSCEKPEE
ncbi:S-layer homology domain-containing protein [Bacillus sp. AK128]